jgi:aminoglycoside 3-N-acetyltransferase
MSLVIWLHDITRFFGIIIVMQQEKRLMSTNTSLSLEQIRQNFQQLGVEAGQVVMLHASLRAIGRVEGGPSGLIEAILEVLTIKGTLMMLVGSNSAVYDIGDMSEAEKKTALAERIAFDPDQTPANPDWGSIGEALLDLKAAYRSRHPDYSFAAVGRMAKELIADHGYDYCHGPSSPLGKLCEHGGKVLLLGAPFQSVTLVHLCEHLASVKGKRVIEYEAPVVEGSQQVLVGIKRFDTRRDIPGYVENDYFGPMVKDYLRQGGGKSGRVGQAVSYMLDAHEFQQFGIFWLESNLPNAIA